MQTITVIVGPDGRVEIPGTHAGQTMTIHVELDAPPARRFSPEEGERIVREQMEESRQARMSISPEDLARALNHGDWLYGPDGLPR